MRTKEKIVEQMEQVMPFEIHGAKPYILEAMEIYKNEQLAALNEKHNELRKVFFELSELAVSAQRTPPCDFLTEKSQREVARINEIARMIELYK